MDNNRTILAVVLVVLLWSGYSLFFAPQQQVQQPVVENTSTSMDQSNKKDSEIVTDNSVNIPDIDKSQINQEEKNI